jgi:hypothetical protein
VLSKGAVMICPSPTPELQIASTANQCATGPFSILL